MTPYVSRVDLQVMIGGYRASGLLQAAVNRTNCYSADTFSLTFAMTPPKLDIEYWASLPASQIEILGSTTVQGVLETTRILTGLIDTVRIDPILQTACIEGRDLAGLLIDSYRQQDFVNQTASEIVASIANYHGLEAIVEHTTGNTGRYYGDGYTKTALARLSRLQSDWDIIVHLARRNKYDAYVEQSSLYFQPPAIDSSVAYPLSMYETQRLWLERSLSASQPTSVHFQSWNSQQNLALQSATTRSATGSIGNIGTGNSAPFLFSEGNLYSGQVDDMVSVFKSEVGRLASILHIQMPFRPALTPRTIISVTDTKSTIDGLYLIDGIYFIYSSSNMSLQNIRAVPLRAL